MSRLQLFAIWLLCVVSAPITLVAMFFDAAIGPTDRAKQIALSEDEGGNAVFGGPATQTISTRTGNALIEGERWAHYAAPVIDLLFGKGHCLANATIAH